MQLLLVDMQCSFSYCRLSKAHFLLGRYYERMQRAKSTTAAGSFAYIGNIVDNYGRALKYGHKFVFQALPRMLTIWYVYHYHWLDMKWTNLFVCRFDYGTHLLDKKPEKRKRDEVPPEQKVFSVMDALVC